MNLLEQIETIVNEESDAALDGTIVNAGGVAVSILALISAHLASDEAVKRAHAAYGGGSYDYGLDDDGMKAAFAAALEEN